MSQSEIPQPIHEAIEGFRPIAVEEGWNDSNGAYSRCGEASREFISYCSGRGLAVYQGSENADVYLGEAEGFSMKREDGRVLSRGHAVAIIKSFGKTLMVDWTAPQYGVMEPWPYVRELHG